MVFDSRSHKASGRRKPADHSRLLELISVVPNYRKRAEGPALCQPRAQPWERKRRGGWGAMDWINQKTRFESWGHGRSFSHIHGPSIRLPNFIRRRICAPATQPQYVNRARSHKASGGVAGAQWIGSIKKLVSKAGATEDLSLTSMAPVFACLILFVDESAPSHPTAICQPSSITQGERRGGWGAMDWINQKTRFESWGHGRSFSHIHGPSIRLPNFIRRRICAQPPNRNMSTELDHTRRAAGVSWLTTLDGFS